MNDHLFIHRIAMIADYYYPPGGVKYENQWMHFNRPFVDEIIPFMKPNSIIFADTLWLDRFELFNKIQVPFILISAEADVTIPYNNYHKQIDCCYSVLNNPLLVKWFSINVDYNHPKLIPIPIGLPKHIPYIVNQGSGYMGWIVSYMMNQVSDEISKLHVNIEENLVKKDKKLLYTRMTVENSDNCFHEKEGIRRQAVNILSDRFDMTTHLVKWEDYITELANHKFCLSLPGKGMDCYRTWEALTFGVIPIVIRTQHMDSIYNELPVLIVDDVDMITEDFLHTQFDCLTENIKQYNFNKITSSYWIDYIFNLI